MAKVVDEDVVEQILIELDAKDLVRFKRVCKSWYLLITSPRFIRSHLKHSYNKDRCNNEFGHRRFSILSYHFFYYIHGSSNGLLCMSDMSSSNFLVCNPITREVRQLELPFWYSSKVIGFGYDSSSDDYKAIVGTWLNEFKTYVQMYMLSLKSDVWKDIGEVRYGFPREDGVLCNGSLHWIFREKNDETLIVSYDLSKDEFKEIPQPDDARYYCSSSTHLVVLKECLCLFCKPSIWDSGSFSVWLMKNYNRKQSWELLPPDHIKGSDYDIVHYLRSAAGETFSDPYVAWDYTNAPIFVQSLVSPHVNGRPTQKSNNKRSAKLFKDEFLRLLDQMPEFDTLGTVKMVTRRSR